jgi:uncharacterized membrane protein
MNWLLIALLAPLFWSISNFTDKYIMAKYFKKGGLGAIVISVALLDFILSPIAFLIDPQIFNFSLFEVFILILAGCLTTFSYILYFNALEGEDASVVVPLYQLIPVFTYLLSLVFLHEVLTTKQILASLLVILGAITLSLDLTHKLPKIKVKILGLMILACFIIAAQSVAFKYVALNSSYWSSTFWNYIGSGVTGLLLYFFVKSYRTTFNGLIKSRNLGYLSILSLSEGLNVVASVIFRYATLIAPVTLVWVINGFQPAFIFIIGVVVTLFFPFIAQESLVKRNLIQKISALILIFLGTYFLNI